MEDIHAIKAPIETPVMTPELLRLLWSFLVLLMIAAIATAYYFYWKKKKATKAIIKKDENEKNNFLLDRKKMAKEKLAASLAFLDKGETEKFYLLSSEALREYLSIIYDSNFTDRTSAEIIANEKITGVLRTDIERFFKEADMAIFAKRLDDKEKGRQVYELAQGIFNKLE